MKSVKSIWKINKYTINFVGNSRAMQNIGTKLLNKRDVNISGSMNKNIHIFVFNIFSCWNGHLLVHVCIKKKIRENEK